jgi:heme/copper-type cytochrome/quinol oxidase subunit 4
VKIFNRYILTVALALLLTTVALAAAGQSALDIYFTIFIIEALVITELYVHINSKARRGLSYVSLLLCGGFAAVLCIQVVKILT